MFILFVAALLTQQCRPHGLLPDPACTPGAVYSTDQHLVCSTRAESRRHVTEAERKAVFAEYGIPWANRHAYEVDHLVPIVIGGSNAIANLWPQPIDQARVKDRVEDAAWALVCSGNADIVKMQHAFEVNWQTVPLTMPSP